MVSSTWARTGDLLELVERWEADRADPTQASTVSTPPVFPVAKGAM